MSARGVLTGAFVGLGLAAAGGAMDSMSNEPPMQDYQNFIQGVYKKQAAAMVANVVKAMNDGGRTAFLAAAFTTSPNTIRDRNLPDIVRGCANRKGIRDDFLRACVTDTIQATVPQNVDHPFIAAMKKNGFPYALGGLLVGFALTSPGTPRKEDKGAETPAPAQS